MEHREIQELTAAYVLDALSDEEEAAFEAHLRLCERCRRELTSLRETSSSLAYAASPASPPPELRERILDRAHAERTNVVPFRRRPRLSAFAAAAAALLAVAFGIWALTLQHSLSEERAAQNRLNGTVQLLANPQAQQFQLSGAAGTLIAAPSGEAALALESLEPAPEGRTYEAWVIEGGTPRAAGLFDGTGGSALFLLDRPLPDGASVAVTVEPAGGVESPTGEPIFTADTA